MPLLYASGPRLSKSNEYWNFIRERGDGLIHALDVRGLNSRTRPFGYVRREDGKKKF
jgi:hypothetical protein